jgi:hypothetical protein
LRALNTTTLVFLTFTVNWRSQQKACKTSSCFAIQQECVTWELSRLHTKVNEQLVVPTLVVCHPPKHSAVSLGHLWRGQIGTGWGGILPSLRCGKWKWAWAPPLDGASRPGLDGTWSASTLVSAHWCQVLPAPTTTGPLVLYQRFFWSPQNKCIASFSEIWLVRSKCEE